MENTENLDMLIKAKNIFIGNNERRLNLAQNSQSEGLYIRYSYNKKVRNTMKIETTKMSSRGQVVIPQGARKDVDADEGTIFTVITSSGDTIILKKVHVPSKETLIRELGKIAEAGQKNAEKLGIKESDVPDIVHRFRKSKNR